MDYETFPWSKRSGNKKSSHKMSLMVWIKVHIKEGNMDEYINLHNSPNGRAYTLSQEGCNSIIRSIDTENKNVLLLTEEWSSMDDWDKYIAKRESGEEDDNFLKKIENLLTNKGHEITFSEIKE